MRSIIFILILVCINHSFLRAQHLNEPDTKQRDSILIDTAKKVVFKFGKGYYREYKEPLIKEGKVEVPGYPEGENIGRKFYSITFLYDNTKEQLNLEYAARVTIWADTGTAFGVTFGNGYGYSAVRGPIKDLLEKDLQEIPYESIQDALQQILVGDPEDYFKVE